MWLGWRFVGIAGIVFWLVGDSVLLKIWQGWRFYGWEISVGWAGLQWLGWNGDLIVIQELVGFWAGWVRIHVLFGDLVGQGWGLDIWLGWKLG